MSQNSSSPFSAELKKQQARGWLLLSIVALASTEARADGIDLWSYFSRLDTGRYPGSSPALLVGVGVLLLIIDYLINLAVLGLPAMRWQNVPARKVATGTVWITILGQLADRIGGMFAIFLSMPIMAIATRLRPNEDHGVSSPILGLSIAGANVICSGIAIAIVVSRVGQRHWRLSKKVSWRYGAAAALLTNPVVIWAGIGNWLLSIPHRWESLYP